MNGSDYISGTVITGEGTYELIVMDLAGNATGVTFTIDTTAPIITVNGSGTIYIEYGNTYTESGATRTDNID